MKRLLIFLIALVVAFPLFLGGLLWFTYENVGEEALPEVSLGVLGETVLPQGYEWSAPVFGGMRYKELYKNPPQEAEPVGELTEGKLDILPPAGYTSSARLLYEGADLWDGTVDDLAAYAFEENGHYELEVESRYDPTRGHGYGSFFFRVAFDVSVNVRLEQSAEVIAQGEVLTIELSNLPAGAEPSAEAYESPVIFIPNGNGRMIAGIAASHDAEPGDYSVQVNLDGDNWTVPYSIEEKTFPEQQLSIDTGSPAITQANSPAAYEEYNNTIPPLFAEYESERWWRGAFTLPCPGELSTQYGLFRYTNGSEDYSRHPAIDISADRGTPIVAPAGGEVLFAEELLNTGNTIVIEHGGGLKSLFYHMDSLVVQTGQMVKEGDALGTVGSTGYSTGPHLHYEARLFGMSVDPISLFDGSNGLFTYISEEEMEEAPEEATPETESESGAEETAEKAPLPEGNSEGLPQGLIWPPEED